MGEFTTLMARDGHEFQAYLAAPQGAPRGAVVVVQEIFGVNRHVRAVTDDYAARGYVASFAGTASRYNAGLASLMELEESRRTRLAAELALVALQRERIVAWVALYRAAGGGWSADAAARP